MQAARETMDLIARSSEQKLDQRWREGGTGGLEGRGGRLGGETDGAAGSDLSKSDSFCTSGLPGREERTRVTRVADGGMGAQAETRLLDCVRG